VIYVMQGRHDPDRVKIGLTTVVAEKRRRGLHTGHGSPLTVLHLLHGDRTAEKALHKRFASSLVGGTFEWFYRTPEINAWLQALEPHLEAEPRETAPAYLRRLGTPVALAALETWIALQAYGRSIGSCSHTLWDMLAGAKGRIEPLFSRVSLMLKGRVFYFPLLMEACVRQGTAPPIGSIRTGRRPKSHRCPQPNRWGPKLRAAQ
jgi:hypothetical protein